MGVITYSQEFKSAIAPSRMFKALIVDSHNIIPMIVPEGIKSVEFIEGEGGAVASRKLTLPKVPPSSIPSTRLMLLMWITVIANTL
ncbi:major pollen allergen Que a 1 [Eucalyptus grandis]|uniref:major pollen allergen Que a 1 n=1 Tax=Eucalyptus grandis TaxID=71139 RepID=UPI00192EE298|nr:major pollen allergen Que a 1 [Eucalyptus grandis]